MTGILLISLIILVSASVSLGYNGKPQIEQMINKIKLQKIDTPDQCTNLSLRDTAYCLRNYVSEFYQYVKTDDTIKLTHEELKERGGDCKNWAEFYYDQARQLNINVVRPVIITGENKAHTFVIISDETGYCMIDQLNVDCYSIE